MGVAENKELVRRFSEEVWDRGNVDFAHEVFADDYVRHDLRPTQALPGSSRPGWEKRCMRPYSLELYAQSRFRRRCSDQPQPGKGLARLGRYRERRNNCGSHEISLASLRIRSGVHRSAVSRHASSTRRARHRSGG
jgi:hypothetical protein